MLPLCCYSALILSFLRFVLFIYFHFGVDFCVLLLPQESRWVRSCTMNYLLSNPYRYEFNNLNKTTTKKRRKTLEPTKFNERISNNISIMQVRLNSKYSNVRCFIAILLSFRVSRFCVVCPKLPNVMDTPFVLFDLFTDFFGRVENTKRKCYETCNLTIFLKRIIVNHSVMKSNFSSIFPNDNDFSDLIHRNCNI